MELNNGMKLTAEDIDAVLEWYTEDKWCMWNFAERDDGYPMNDNITGPHAKKFCAMGALARQLNIARDDIVWKAFGPDRWLSDISNFSGHGGAIAGLKVWKAYLEKNMDLPYVDNIRQAEQRMHELSQ